MGFLAWRPLVQCARLQRRPSRTFRKDLEHLQGHNGHLISETKGRGNLQEAAWRLQSPGEDCDSTREHAPSEALAASEAGHTRDSSEVPKNERLGGWGFQKGREMLSKAAACLVEKLPSSNLLMNRDKGEASLAQPGSPDRAEQDGWEMVSRHSSWGDVSLGGSLEASVLSLSQEMDHGRHTLVEARGWEGHGKAMSSGSQRVRVRFQVHYVPSADGQLVAVTGNHESLGRWKTCIPLQHGKDGFWSRSVLLPADAVMEWKFVLVENGKVIRWEECSNRFLETGREDKVVHKWWGFP
ncbi:Starch-binding domain-containing protein 1 [Tupaia chinensis]|uniref:Starch-binding domain-containing protein 1 n=1 Tax=Tupaia chinensis TaxID=246437 RepID=L9L5S1_TUPCH|nr:Starch-binding domain-containing protein 1 [Tupaia chinensis]